MCLTFYWLIDIAYSELVGWYTRHLARTKFGNQKLLVIFLIKIKILKKKAKKDQGFKLHTFAFYYWFT